MKRIACIIAALLIATPALAFEIPQLKGRVNDNANLLTSGQASQLNDKLKDIEASSKDGSQVVVLTVPSLDGESIDKVRNDVFHAWKLGQAGKDNGILIIIAPVERKIGIEVGYGLESALPDGPANRIIDTQMKPHLKKGSEDWFKALEGAATAVGSAIVGREKNEAAQEPASSNMIWIVLAALGGIGSVGGIVLAGAGAMRRQREEAAAEEAAALRRYTESRRATSTHGGLAAAAAVGGLAGALASRPRPSPPKPIPRRADDTPSRSSSYDSSPSYSSSSSSSGSSSSDSSSYSGGGGDSGGGGSSSDF